MFVNESDYDINKFWELETIGIKNVTQESEEEELVNEFGNSLVNNDNRYQVAWPWKLPKYELHDNYYVAEARLK